MDGAYSFVSGSSFVGSVMFAVCCVVVWLCGVDWIETVLSILCFYVVFVAVGF